MSGIRETWIDEVATAAKAGDQQALVRLYGEGKPIFGDQLPHEWSEVLSAWDSSAVTG